MTSDLSEEGMRRALFGDAEPAHPVAIPLSPEPIPEVVFVKPSAPAPKKKAAKAFMSRLRVLLRVGNEFEGKMFDFIHEADTLSTLLAEQEAVKAARKKFRYVQFVEVKSM